MNRHRQKGLSLLACAILSMLLGFAAMAALFSMRYDRNLFAEAMAGFVRKTDLPATVAEAKKKIADTTSASGPLRKCVVKGAVTYSNVECPEKGGAGTVIQVSDSRGFEAPKVPVVEVKEAAPMTAQEKMIEKATR